MWACHCGGREGQTNPAWGRGGVPSGNLAHGPAPTLLRHWWWFIQTSLCRWWFGPEAGKPWKMNPKNKKGLSLLHEKRRSVTSVREFKQQHRQFHYQRIALLTERNVGKMTFKIWSLLLVCIRIKYGTVWCSSWWTWCIDVRMVGHLSTSPFIESYCPARDVSILLSKICCMYHVTDSTRTAAGLSPLLVRPPGTVFQTQSTIWTPPKLLFRRPLKTFCRHRTGALSSLVGCTDNVP